MAYVIKSVSSQSQTSRNVKIDTTYLYDTPEETLCENPISVETPEGIKYASVDIATQTSHIKFVDGNGNTRRINAKGRDVYIPIYEEHISVIDKRPLRGNYLPLWSDTIEIDTFSPHAHYPLAITLGSSSSYDDTAEGGEPVPGLTVSCKITAYGRNADGSLVIKDYPAYIVNGGGGSGVLNSIAVAGGSGKCSWSMASQCSNPPSTCGCTYISPGNYSCTWEQCYAETPIEEGGIGAIAERAIVIPALLGKEMRSLLGGAEPESIYMSFLITTAGWGTQGTCDGKSGYCGSAQGSYTNYACKYSCTSTTTDSKCSCSTSTAGKGYGNSVNGGSDLPYELKDDTYADIVVESIQ